MKDASLPTIVRKLVYFSPFLYATYLLRFDVAGIPLTVLEVFTYLLFALWMLSLFRGHKEVQWTSRIKPYWIAAFLIIVGVTVGVLMAPGFIELPSGDLLNAKRVALGVWKGWVVAPLLYFAVVTQVIRSEKQAAKLLRMYVYSAGLITLIAHGFGLFSDGVTIDLRLRGFYESANYLALYVVPATVLNLMFVMKRTVPLTRQYVLDLANLVVLTYSLFFTQSYAGILAVFGAVTLYVLYYIFHSREYRKKGLISIGALLAVFGMVFLSQINTPKFKQALDYKNRSSTSVRLEIYETSLALVSDNFVWGVGPGLFQAHYQNAAPIVLERAPLEWNMPHSHNIFLGFWLNAGLIGLFGFALLLVLVHTRFTYPLVALWALLLHGLFDMPFWKNDLAMIFWLIIAMIYVMQRFAPKAK